MIKPFRILVVLFFVCSPLIGQEATDLTMAEVVEAVLTENHSIKMAQQDVEIARGNYQESRSLFLPNIRASHTGFTTTNPLNAFGSKLNQEVLTAADFNPDLLNNPDRIDNFATRFEFEQPLLNMDGIYMRKAAKKQLDASQFQYVRKQDYLRLEAQKAYMQLQLAEKSVKVLEDSKKTVEANLKLTTDYFGEGLLQKADLLMAQVRLSEVENQLQQARSNRQNAANYLSVLMNQPLGQVYRLSDSLQLRQVEMPQAALPEERADLKAMELAVEAYRQSYTADKMSFLPRLNAFGNYQLFDDKIFNANANGYLLGAELSWDILKGSSRFGKASRSKAQYERSRIEYEQYRNQSQMEMDRALRQLEDARKAVELYQLALEQSAESYRIRKNRFEEGLEKVSDLLLAETQLSQKELQYAQAVFQHNYAIAYLEFLTVK